MLKASAGHHGTVTARVLRSLASSTRVDLTFCALHVAPEFEVASFGGGRSAASDVLMSRWVELVLSNNHGVLGATFILFMRGSK